MADDAHTRNRAWPHGPFLDFSGRQASRRPPTGATEARPGGAPQAPAAPQPGTAGAAPGAPKPSRGAPGGRTSRHFRKRHPAGDEPPAAAGAPAPAPEGAPGATGTADAPGDAPAQEDAQTEDGLTGFLQREAALLREGDVYAWRRVMAARYGTGALLGWALGASHWAHQGLEYVHGHPGTAVCWVTGCASAWAAWVLLGTAQHIVQPTFHAIGQLFTGLGRVFHVVPGLGAVADFVVGTWNTVFAQYWPFRLIASAAVGFYLFPLGYAAVGYAQSKGLDTAYWTPRLAGAAATAAAWYAIDRRTEAYARSLPGHAFHWATCAVTGTVGLATVLYTTP